MKTILILVLLYYQATTVLAVNINHGKTYSIAEPDLMLEIQNKAAQVDWSVVKNNMQLDKRWVDLATARTSKSYTHTPKVVLPFEVKDNNGKVIYPKNYAFNPLDYSALNTRLIVVANACHLQAITPKVSEADIVMVANNNPLPFIKKTGKQAFMITQEAAKRLGIKRVPSSISQVGNQFLIKQFQPVRCD